MARLKIADFKQGVQGAPGFSGRRGAARDLLNLDIDLEGRPVVRKGYTATDLEVTGFGEQLVVAHYLGDADTEPVTRAFKIQAGASWVNTGRRLFVAGDLLTVALDSYRWMDLATGEWYDWTLPTPTFFPRLSIVSGLGDADEDLPDNERVSDLRVGPTTFNSETPLQITFTVVNPINLSITISDFNDDLIRFVNDNDDLEVGTQFEVGTHTLEWDGNNQSGAEVARGVYSIGIRNNDGNYIYTPISITYVRDEDLSDSDELAEPDFLEEVRDIEDLETGTGFRGGWYTIAYTYASSEYGIETAPSTLNKIYISAFERDNQEYRAQIRIRIETNTNELPTWADEIKIYAQKGWYADGIRFAKETPFTFTHIGSLNRDDLDDEIETAFTWSNEKFESPRQAMFSQEFETEPSIRNLQHIIYYAGRIWGYDTRENVVRFSLIDSRGVENYDVFPYADTALPHGISVSGSWQSKVQTLETIPGRGGGVYVFFRDAIRTIVGQALITGIYSAEVGPQTDLDASGGINGTGTISGRTVIPFDGFVIFLSSGRTLYQLAGQQFASRKDIGMAIQPWLDDATDAELEAAFAFRYLEKYHLVLSGAMFVLNTKWKYWSRYSWDFDSVVWSQGGEENESEAYALFGDTVVQLYEGTRDRNSEIEWEWLSNWQHVPINSKVSAVYAPHYGDMDESINLRLDVDATDGEPEEAYPDISDSFRMGVWSDLIMDRFRVQFSGETSIPPFREVEAEVT